MILKARPSETFQGLWNMPATEFFRLVIALGEACEGEEGEPPEEERTTPRGPEEPPDISSWKEVETG